MEGESPGNCDERSREIEIGNLELSAEKGDLKVVRKKRFKN